MKDPQASVRGQELFTRFQEVHLQRGYTLEEMISLIERSGLIFLKSFDADTMGEATDKSERIYCVAKSEDGFFLRKTKSPLPIWRCGKENSPK